MSHILPLTHFTSSSLLRLQFISGDWALQRSAAIFVEGTENVAVDACVLSRLDGNAIMLSGYNRGKCPQVLQLIQMA